jgi:hypothetical protein
LEVWLLALAVRVYRSRFLPRFLGVWLTINGFAYVTISFAGVLLPQYQAQVFTISGSKEEEPLSKTVQAYLRRAPEGTLGRLIVEMSILLRVSSGQDSNRVLAEAAKEYNISAETIAATVRKEFATRDRKVAESLRA